MSFKIRNSKSEFKVVTTVTEICNLSFLFKRKEFFDRKTEIYLRNDSVLHGKLSDLVVGLSLKLFMISCQARRKQRQIFNHLVSHLNIPVMKATSLYQSVSYNKREFHARHYIYLARGNCRVSVLLLKRSDTVPQVGYY